MACSFGLTTCSQCMNLGDRTRERQRKEVYLMLHMEKRNTLRNLVTLSPFSSVFGVLTDLGPGEEVVLPITFPLDSMLSPLLQGA